MGRTGFTRLIAALIGGLVSLVCAALAQTDSGIFTLPGAEGRPLEEIGRIAIVDNDPVLSSKMMGLFDAQGKEIRRSLLSGVSERTLLLSPGTYTVALHCDSGGSWYPMPTRLRVDSGHTYTLWCKNITGLTARVKFKAQSHVEWEESRAPEQATPVEPGAN